MKILRNDYYAQYTISLQELVESKGVDLFNFDYDFVDKEELERRFYNKYWFREIGYETYSMFHFKFKEMFLNRLKHYGSIFERYKDIDPLLDYSEVVNYLQEEISKTKEDMSGEMSGSSSGNEKQTQKDTPITVYDNSDFVSFIGTNENSNESNQQSVGEMLRDINKDMNSERKKTIMSESMLKRLNEYVVGFIDVMERFLNEFNVLFMGVY